MNIAPKTPAAPRGVKNPSARDRPPPNSPRITRAVQSHPGLKPCVCKPCVILVKPGPPNQPKSFCAPCAAIVNPTTRRRMSNPRLSEIVMTLPPLKTKLPVWKENGRSCLYSFHLHFLYGNKYISEISCCQGCCFLSRKYSILVL